MHTQAATITVQFPHGHETIPARINGKPTRFATVDEDGSLIVWTTGNAPVLDEGMGVWIAGSESDLQTVRTVGAGEYPAYAEAMRSVDVR
jgi:hypothetical protein